MRTSYEAACGEDGNGGRAAMLNRNGEPIEQAKIARYGTIDWLFRQYKTEKAYTEKVSPQACPCGSSEACDSCARCASAR